MTVYSEIDFPPRCRVRDKPLRLCVSAGNKMPISPDRCKSRVARNRHKNRAPSCDFASQSSSCYSSGDLTTSSQVHLPSKATLSSAHFRPASLDIGLAFRCPISRARRQMRGDRIKCLGLRTYRTSCINATDSICRCARKKSQSVVKLGQWERVDDNSNRSRSACGNANCGTFQPFRNAPIWSL